MTTKTKVKKKKPVRKVVKKVVKPTKRSKGMKVGDVVTFHESAKHEAEKAKIVKVHKDAGLFNVEVTRGKVRVLFSSIGTAKDKGGAYLA